MAGPAGVGATALPVLINIHIRDTFEHTIGLIGLTAPIQQKEQIFKVSIRYSGSCTDSVTLDKA